MGEFHHALLDKLSEDSSDNAVSGDCAGIFPEAEGRATQWSLEGCGAAVEGGWIKTAVESFGVK